MFIYHRLALPVVMIIFPWLMGNLLAYKNTNTYARTISFRFGMGLILEMVIFYLLAMPLLRLNVSLSFLSILFAIVCTIICIVSIFLSKKEIISIPRYNIRLFTFWLMLIVIAIEVFLNFISTSFNYSDDATYVTMVTAMVDSNELFRPDFVDPRGWLLAIPKYYFTSYYQYVAALCYLTKLHPLIMTQTVIPCLYTVPLYHMGTFLFSRWLLHKEEKTYILVTLISGLTVYGGYSQFTITKRLLQYPWNGKAILAVIVIPYVFWMVNEFFSRQPQKIEILYLALALLAGTSVSLYGAAILPIMIMLLSAGYAIKEKNIKTVIVCALVCAIVLPILIGYILSAHHVFGG